MHSKIRNPKLYEAMKLFVIAVSKLILRDTKRPLKDFDFLLLDYRGEIVQLPEAKNCAFLMQSEISIKREFASKISIKGQPLEMPGVAAIFQIYLRPLLARASLDSHIQ